MFEPKLEATPPEILEGGLVVVRGTGWPVCAATVRVDGAEPHLHGIAAGHALEKGLQPAPDGELVFYLRTVDWKAGPHEIVVTSEHARAKAARTSVTVVERIEVSELDENTFEDPHHAYKRQKALARELETPELVRQRIADVREIRKRGSLNESPIVRGACNWTPCGPSPAAASTLNTGHSGRVTAIAVDPADPNIVSIGTAGGGVWKTTDRGASWQPFSDYQGSLAIGALTLDPRNGDRLLAGTGDEKKGQFGVGILRREPGTTAWTEEGAPLLTGYVYQIVFDPADTTSRHILAATNYGVYETVDGTMWTQLRAGWAQTLAIVSAGGTLTAVAGFKSEGLFRANRSGTTWSAWTRATDADLPATYGRIELAQCAGTPRTMYAVVVQTTYDGIQGIFRTTDGGTSWHRVDVRFNTSYACNDRGDQPHSHSLSVPVGDLLASPAVARRYTTGSGGSPSHTHTIDITAAQMRDLASGAQLVLTTNAAAGHTHSYYVMAFSQADYALSIAVHPSNPNIVFFGALGLYRNTTGGGVFETVGPVHPDQHSFAFEPADPDRHMWCGNDGGVYFSEDRGTTWKPRNNGLAATENYDIGVHPRWENVLLAGSQDNGGHRFSGSEVWRNVYPISDATGAAIDPSAPHRMYLTRQNATSLERSERGGEPDSWESSDPIPGSSNWASPFLVDTTGAVYFGNRQLWRSPSRGTGWVALTAPFSRNIGAIVVDPTDLNTIYFAAGHVYRVRYRTSWTIAGVTLDDLGGVNISGSDFAAEGVAVDWTGVVWATVLGTFSSGNPHVFRREGTSWVARSSGLSDFVGMDPIISDPVSRTLFCAGRLGIYRSSGAGGGIAWSAWDAGIPNVEIRKLVIGPGRLIRAATYGRGIWEREIDPPSPCLSTDVYVRDNVVDSGRRTPSPEDVPHPFDPTRRVYHWQSPDIKVDAEEGSPVAFQTPDPITDAVGFATIVHRNPRRGRMNRFYAQVHNRGPEPATNVYVRAFFTDATAGLMLPSNFWTGGRPFTGDVITPRWTHVGPAAHFDRLFPAQPRVASWTFSVPPDAAEHSCLLVVVTCAETPLDGAGITSADELVLMRKLVCLKNLHVVDMPTRPGMATTPDDALLIEIPSVTREALTTIRIDWGNLPQEARIFMAFEEPRNPKQPLFRSQKGLARAGVTRTRAPEAKFAHRETRCGRERRFKLDEVLEAKRPKDNTTNIPGLRIPQGDSIAMQLRVLLPDGASQSPYHFDVIQCRGQKIVGGSTYVIGGTLE